MTTVFSGEGIKIVSAIVLIAVYFSVIYVKPTVLHALQSWKNTTRSITLRQCTIILRKQDGRLGNRLFMFASAYGLSLNRSCHLYINPAIITELGQSFEINLPHSLLSKSYSNDSKFVEKIDNHCSFLPHVFYSNYTCSLELSGYWQVYKYFVDYKQQLRRQLRFKQSILDRVNDFLSKTNNRSNSTLVGLHIRRGDFLSIRRVSSLKYIFQAMSYFQMKYGLVTFVIVSDDKVYCQKTFAHRNNVVITPSSFSAAEDLATLAMCDHAIITVGTFGWWGAFLLHNESGEVISDSKPDHSPLDVKCRHEDYFPYWFSFLNKTD
ncbi:unnamed protein product [Adineta ricciae]|uniref:L-Fucosyltransferase n=1 Tax=Adineta ricciae TaxID=249248 RepID=A0A815TDH2_ADIRI|nr:unnamed protein product [Adineta ricciae]CAF1499578.1 unnamed protein product [Adineta ricciae]